MTDKTEWELIDEPAHGARGGARDDARDGMRNGAQERAGLAQAILGPRWKFKVAGMAALASVVVILVAMLTGVIFLAAAGFALLSLGIAKVRRMLQGGRRRAAGYPDAGPPAHWKNPR